jgi:hypothetical protein
MRVKRIRKDTFYIGTWNIMAMLKAGPAGRPKSRWEDYVRNDLKMKLIKWAKQVQDRLKWKDIVEKAKILSQL